MIKKVAGFNVLGCQKLYQEVDLFIIYKALVMCRALLKNVEKCN